MTRRTTGFVGHTMFLSRWLQAPLYLGLIVVQAVYAWRFGLELWHLAHEAFLQPTSEFTESQVVIAVLGLIDIVMIANLLIMIIVGGYETFVSRIDLENHPDKPDWLSHVNENVLKVKLAMAIVGISSIHLLKTFIQAGAIGQPVDSALHEAPPTVDAVMWQTIIHTAFLVSALVLAWIDRIMSHNRHHVPTHAPVSPAATGVRESESRGEHYGAGENHRSAETSHAR